MQHRQGERCSLAGAGRCLREHVPSRQEQRDGLALPGVGSSYPRAVTAVTGVAPSPSAAKPSVELDRGSGISLSSVYGYHSSAPNARRGGMPGPGHEKRRRRSPRNGRWRGSGVRSTRRWPMPTRSTCSRADLFAPARQGARFVTDLRLHERRSGMGPRSGTHGLARVAPNHRQ